MKDRKRIIKYSLKSWLYFFLQTQSLLMKKVVKNKKDLELLTLALQVTKQVHKNLFISYNAILSDQVWCNIKQVLSYSKNSICKFMQANSWHRKLFHFHLSFKSEKCRREGKKLQKIEGLEDEKSFLDGTKNIFHSFWRAIIWWKNKNVIKNSRHKL